MAELTSLLKNFNKKGTTKGVSVLSSCSTFVTSLLELAAPGLVLDETLFPIDLNKIWC